MSFDPQYSNWGTDDFLSSDDAIISSPTIYDINNGIVSLRPIIFSGQLFAFDAPWDPVPAWNVENTLDDLYTITGQFSIVATTGYQSTNVGQYGNSGDYNYSAFFTKTVTPETGAAGTYIHGSTSCFVYNLVNYPNSDLSLFTLEFGARVIETGSTHDLYTSPSSGVSCHGVYFGTRTSSTFVEIHPNGLKVHGITGAILPGDYSSSLRRIRLVKRNSALALISDNGTSLYVPGAFTAGSHNSAYIAFGAPPFYYSGAATFTGVSGTFHDVGSKYDPYGLSGIAAFEGTTLWDDVKLLAASGVTTYGNGYTVTWPTSSADVYTAPWYPSRSLKTYLGAVVESIPREGGSISVTAQYLALSGQSDTTWVTSSASLTLSDSSTPENYINLSSIPVYHGFDNALRFKITAASTGGPCHAIDAITVIGDADQGLVDIAPSWKLSSLPKDIYFEIDRNRHLVMEPLNHYEDEIFITDRFTGRIRTGQYLPVYDSNLQSGQVLSSFTGSGIVTVPDGPYGSAISNLFVFTGNSGVVLSNGSYTVDTGIFHGNLNNSFTYYPSVSALSSIATGSASVTYDTFDYRNFEGDTVRSQVCTVYSYTGSIVGGVGFQSTGLIGPPVSGMVALFKGVIHIPNGPGVTVSIRQDDQLLSYFLDGYMYREPKPFSCAALCTGLATNAGIVFAVPPRSTFPTPVSGEIWKEWTDELNLHNNTTFTVYELDAEFCTHSYLKYTNTNSVSRISMLDDLSVYDTVPYSGLRRDAAIFDGWVRPHGFMSGSFEVPWFESISSDNRGLTVYLNRSGEIRTELHLNMHSSAYGLTGDSYQMVGLANNANVRTGRSGAINIGSNSQCVRFGDWNHIGVYQDVRTLGDTYTAMNQPLLASTGFYNGARSAKLYLEINGRLVNSYDIAVDSYDNNIITSGSVASNYPDGDVSTPAWPKIPIYATTGDTRTAKFGEWVASDFDYVRFGVRTHVDARAHGAVYGAKTSPPTFTPWDAIKIPTVTSGGNEHYQYAHIYRFDSPDVYNLWDDGFSTNHGIAINYGGDVDWTSRGIKPVATFLQQEDGPKGRPALRIGPGMNITIPFSHYDERVFNGTGSLSLAQGGVNNLSGSYYINKVGYLHSNMGTWVTGFDHSLTSSNSRVVMGGKFKINSLPNTGFGDLFSFQEVTSGNSYGLACLYLGINSGGNLVYGTRRAGVSDGNSSQYVVGQFTGVSVPLNTYLDLGIDAQMASGNGYINVYTGGIIANSTNLVLSVTGALHPNTGRAMAYQGLLGSGLVNPIHRSSFNIGGEPLRTTKTTWNYMDLTVSEFFVGLPLSRYDWPWTTFAGTGIGIEGHTDVAVKNHDTVINYVYGTGAGTNALYYGVTQYPATDWSGAGEHLLWSTSTNGNDFECRRGNGVPLYDEVLFNNAESYYVNYENDSVTKAFGSTNSPIQFYSEMPPEGVNLALVSSKDWRSDSALTTFDMSDTDYANVVDVLRGDRYITSFSSGANGSFASNAVNSDDIRMSSVSLWDEDSFQSYVGYFVHLIGGEVKGVYSQTAPAHRNITGNYSLYHSTMEKIKQSIVIKDSNGVDLSFDEFPYSIMVSPYSIDTPVTDISGPMHHFSGATQTGYFNSDKTFTCALVAHTRSIGKTVFIHFPSILYSNGDINLQDSEVYNPVPLLKKIDPINAYGATGNIIAPTGSFSLQPGNELKNYNVTLWGINLTGWT